MLPRPSSASLALALVAACGGHPAPAPDANPFPAPHEAPPQVVTRGGSVLAHPRLAPVTFPSDPLQAQIDQFAALIPTSTYWGAVAADYGATTPTITAPVHLAQPAATMIMDSPDNNSPLKAWLAGQLDGTHPEWPVPDANTLYVLLYPPGTSGTYCLTPTTCVTDGGYHDSLRLPNGALVPYAVIIRVGQRAFPWGVTLSGMAWITGATSHEVLEAISDPSPRLAPAFSKTDADHVVDSILTGGEIGDMCEFVGEAWFTPTDFYPYTVQRIWSNTAAAAGHDPCLPQPAGEPYFNSAPVLTDPVTITVLGFPAVTKGVLIPVGTSKTIEVDLFSDGATTEPWMVSADEPGGASGHLSFSFDHASGVNGDKLQLTIHSLSIDSAYDAEAFEIVSTSGTRHNIWRGFVGH
jgi:hypothetical protein